MHAPLHDVYVDDQLIADYMDISALPRFVMKEIRRFFEDYKTLEGKQVLVEDFMGPAEALGILGEALALYRRLRRGELNEKPDRPRSPPERL